MYPIHKIDYVKKDTTLTTEARAQHIEAVRHPRDHEKPIVYALEAWLLFAQAYFKRTRRNIGSVPKDLDAWQCVGRTLATLIATTDTGRLHAVTLMNLINDNINEQTKP